MLPCMARQFQHCENPAKPIMILAMTVLGPGLFISAWDHVDLLKGAVEMRFLHTTFS